MSALPMLEKPPENAPPGPAAGRRPHRPTRPHGPQRKGDWHWQARNAITTVEALEAALDLTDAERRGARRAVAAGFPMSITPYYLSLCDARDPACPIRRQCVPTAEEGAEVPGDLRDPLGEEEHEVVPSLVRRYPDRVLLLATDRCGVYCRFCTRSRMVGDGGGAIARDKLERIVSWLHAHPEVRDVIVSGGDPLLMATDRLRAVLAAVRAVPSIDTIRLASRCPVTMPQRITTELVRALKGLHPIWLMTHFNHPKELTPASERAVARLVDAGFPVMNQTVLLRGVNDDADVLEQLFRGLIRRRVRPYYLLQADPVRGTGHLRTPLSTGIAIMERLQGRLTGIALPKLIVDTPGGRGKVPVGPEYVIARGEGTTSLRTFRGEIVDYVDPPVVSRQSSVDSSARAHQKRTT
ncbi:MAG: KamA family radical SAM protein [Deltaproteobacteria bacterium]|nr:KamA family radical SAM protein [Deltaproteobacteria bacterium]